MKIYRIFFVMVLLTVFASSLQAQIPRPLKIGDTVPSILLKEMLFYKDPSANIKDFIGKKALIIDFIATNCAPCLSALPKVDTLNKRYINQLAIIAATYQDRKTMTELFQADRFKNYKLPIVINAHENLSKYFVHNSLPHQIWIDKHGVVKARVSGTRYLTDDNLLRLVSGEDLNFFEASAVPTDRAKPEVPLLRNNYDPKIMLGYSYVSKYDSQIKSGESMMRKNDATGLFRIRMQNVGFVDLFWDAHFGLQGPFDTLRINRHVTIIREDTKRIASENDIRNYTNIFCYDGYGLDRKSAMSQMRNTLEEVFQIKSKVETRLVKCLVLKEIDSLKLYQHRANKRSGLYRTDEFLVLDNVLISKLESHLNVISDNYLFVDRTGYKGMINFKFRWLPNNLDLMNEDLKPFGLQFVLETLPKTVIVLRDK